MTGTTLPPPNFFFKFVSQLCIFMQSYTFLAHDSICLVRCPSVCPHVYHTGGSVKTVEIRIMKFSPHGTAIR